MFLNFFYLKKILLDVFFYIILMCHVKNKKNWIKNYFFIKISYTGLSFFFDLRKLHFPDSAFYEFRWASKTPTISDSYKNYTSLLELKICYIDFKFFVITLHPRTPYATLSNKHLIIYLLYCSYLLSLPLNFQNDHDCKCSPISF